ncbi:MAG: mechanosensitive ion channel domain-containing protein [bacterium]
MDLTFLEQVRRILNTKLFILGTTTVTLATLVMVGVILLGGYVLSRVLQRAIERAFHARGVTDEGTVGVTTRLVHYLLAVVTIGASMQTIGIKLATLFAAGAVLALAIGFALQTMLQNFVAGVILMVERTIKPGDILEVQGVLIRVTRLGIRSTVARTRENEDLLIPNSTLVQSAVKNLTFRDKDIRLRIPVGVTYGSDMAKVRTVLEAVGHEYDKRIPEPGPLVLLRKFGSSSVDWELSVWTTDPWREQLLRSELQEAVWNAFKAAGITIAFPQLDVHLDPPVVQALQQRPRAA